MTGFTLHSLEDMTKGWFIGPFEPSVLKTGDFEVGYKKYSAGDFEEMHHHKIATEITLIVNGQARMCGEIRKSGDILILSPGAATDFLAITDVETCVIKIPGAKDDKYFGQ